MVWEGFEFKRRFSLNKFVTGRHNLRCIQELPLGWLSNRAVFCVGNTTEEIQKAKDIQVLPIDMKLNGREYLNMMMGFYRGRCVNRVRPVKEILLFEYMSENLKLGKEYSDRRGDKEKEVLFVDDGGVLVSEFLKYFVRRFGSDIQLFGYPRFIPKMGDRYVVRDAKGHFLGLICGLIRPEVFDKLARR